MDTLNSHVFTTDRLVTMDDLVALAQQIKAELKRENKDYADPENQRFPIYSPELAKASFYLWKSAAYRMRYSDDEWELIGNTIAEAIGEADALHDESEDVNLVLQAMVLIRELIAREARDGYTDNTYKLSELVTILSMLTGIKFEEELEVWLEQQSMSAPAPAEAEQSAESSETEGEEPMALDEQAKQEITEIVTTAMASQTQALLDGLKALITPPAPAVAEAEETEEEEAPESEAAFPPKKKKGEDEEDEEDAPEDEEDEDVFDKNKKKAKAEEDEAEVVEEEAEVEAVAESEDETEALAEEPAVTEEQVETVASANEDVEPYAETPAERAARLAEEAGEGEAEAGAEESDEVESLLRGEYSGISANQSRVYKFSDPKDIERYRRDVAEAQRKALQQRIPTGQVAVAGANTNGEENDPIERFIKYMFRR